MRAAATIVLLLVIVIGCTPPQPVEETGSETQAPRECTIDFIEVSANDGIVTVAWSPRCSGVIAGYNIYVSEVPLADHYAAGDLPASVKPHNLSVYPGDTEPDDGIEHYDAEGLVNGRTYFVSVRAVYPDRSFSGPSQEVVAVPGPRGTMTLAIRYSGEDDGFSFRENGHVRADATENDLVFFAKDGADYLDAPSRLNGFLRKSQLMVLSATGSLTDAAAAAARSEKGPSADRVEVSEGDWVWVVTEDGENALVRIDSIAGTGSDRRVTMSYAFVPSKGVLVF